jgi:hypothetical protein
LAAGEDRRCDVGRKAGQEQHALNVGVGDFLLRGQGSRMQAAVRKFHSDINPLRRLAPGVQRRQKPSPHQ